MPLSSQFQLSLELTSLIPFGARDILKFARALQRSGSDLVAEDDLVQIFGRNKLEERFESTFKTVIQDSSQNTLLSQALDIVIEGGAGPSVQRALKHREHFATIVQLSMLLWIHERQTLTSALLTAMRRRIQGAPPGENTWSVPGETALLGFLRACDEQTGAFPWQRWFDGVSLKLGIVGRRTADVSSVVIPVCILQGLLDMLTAVQSFPEDRIVYVEGFKGVVSIVTWAYCLLGLTVSAKMKSDTVSFGEGNPSVIIDATDEWGQSRVCLFDASHELVLAVGEDEDEEIESEVKFAAKGYGIKVLKRASADMNVVSRVAHFSLAIARCIARRLQIIDSPRMILGPTNKQSLECLKPFPPPKSRASSGKLSPKRHESPTANEANLLMAESFLFDGLVIDRDMVEEYMSMIFEATAADECCDITMTHFLSIEPDIPLQLALVMLAFSNITDLSMCEQWRLGVQSSVDSTRIAKYLRERWIGENPVPLGHDDWYQVLASLMLGSRCWSEPESLTHACLVSNWGWTMWMSSFGNYQDPIILNPGVLTVRQGTPSRGGERRHVVVDGPDVGLSGSTVRSTEETRGQTATWQCMVKTEAKQSLIAVREDRFVVSVRSVINDQYFCRGYRELHRLRWNSWIVSECKHDDVPVELPVDVATTKYLIWTRMILVPRIYISLVRGNQIARWGAMAGVKDLRNVLLASSHNCLKCVLESLNEDNPELNWLIVS